MGRVDRAASIRAKIDRANEHIHNLKAEIDAWSVPNRYVIPPEDDPQTGDEVYRIHGSDLTPPRRLSVIAGEVVHGLRSALDHLAWQLVKANCGRLGRHVQFPIFEEAQTTEEYETKVEQMIKGASSSAIVKVKSLKAYKGGNEPALCIVHSLDNLEKHRLLVTTGLARFGVRDSKQISPVFLEDGSEVYRIKADLRNTPGLYTPPFALDSLDIALGEPGIVEGEPLVKCLHGLAQAQRVDKVIKAFLPELSV